MMIAAIILAASLVFLVQFFIAYCRSLLAKSYALELSPETHQVTGIEDHLIHRDDFRRLVQLVELCPEPGNDGAQLKAVRVYYSLVKGLRAVMGSLGSVRDWTEKEQASCGYFAAVVLDRRIAHNRGLMAEQIANHT